MQITRYFWQILMNAEFSRYIFVK